MIRSMIKGRGSKPWIANGTVVQSRLISNYAAVEASVILKELGKVVEVKIKEHRFLEILRQLVLWIA